MSADVLQLRLSPHHSLDLVRLPKSRRYRIVFAERQGVQRRAFVEISFDDAIRIAKFLASGAVVPEAIDAAEPTLPFDESSTIAMPALMRDELIKKDD